jgi:hypothetical protein
LLDGPTGEYLESFIKDKKIAQRRNVHKVSLVWHFDTYLVLVPKKTSIYKVAWTASYVWTKKDGKIEGPVYAFDKDNSGPNLQPSSDEIKALNTRYPNQDILPSK